MTKTIYIVDDDESILDVLSIMLKEGNYNIIRAKDSVELLSKLDEKCSLILLDVWMPGKSGDETVRTLKNDKKTKHIPIVLLSALNDLPTIANDCGADGYLQKPFDMQELLDVVKKYSK